MKIKLSIFLFFLLFLASCGDKETKQTLEVFDRALLLNDLCEEYILPEIDSFAKKAATLNSSILEFEQFPDINYLNSAQAAWKQAFLSFQTIRMFNFGPGEKSLIGDINENLATWPVNISVIETRVSSSDLKMDDFRRDSRGFLSLEYLLFSPNVLDSFSSNTASLRFNFAKALSDDINTWASSFKQDWSVYASVFKANTGKSAGSSCSEFYNHWLHSFEDIKNLELALPAGLRVGQTQAEPQLVQAYYSSFSIPALKAHVHAIENLWFGNNAQGINKTGFDDYLDKLHGGTDLKAATIEQWKAVNLCLAQLQETDKLSELVLSDLPKVQKLHEELQKLTRYLKSDLSSLLGIAITYSSGDGD